jgi:translation initiation factor IF-2
MVPVSARTKVNLDLLLEMILLSADMLDLKANPGRPAMGNVLEAKLDRTRSGGDGSGTERHLRVGDHFICGSVFGRVRAMFDDRGEPIREAEPSTPVEVLGLDAVPDVGDTFQAVTDTAKAKQIVMYREVKAREQSMARSSRLTLDELHDQLKEGEIKDLNIILKTDVGGTAEVLADTLQKLSNEKIKIRVLRSAVGAITESDVLLATTSEAIIIGFNVRPERNAQTLADREKVDIRMHTIITNW